MGKNIIYIWAKAQYYIKERLSRHEVKLEQHEVGQEQCQ